MPETALDSSPHKVRILAEPTQGTGFKLSGTLVSYPQGAFVANYRSAAAAAPALIEIDKLYPADKDSRSQLIAALGLLADAISLLEKARISLAHHQIMDADRYAQKFETLLMPLFAQRKIGDGYASAINSLHFALINQHGVPLTFEQLTTVWRILKELRDAPFISFERSLKWVEEFEECHLKVDPPVLANFIEDFEGE